MTPAPAYSSPSSTIPEAALPQNSASAASHPVDPDRPSSFAKLLHQANDDAGTDTDSADKTDQSQSQNKSAKQATFTTPTPVVVPVKQQTVPAFAGFLSFSSTPVKSEKSATSTEQDEQTPSGDQKKSDASAITTGTALLMQALAGLGIPQITQPSAAPPAAAQQPATKQAARPGGHIDLSTKAASTTIGFATPINIIQNRVTPDVASLSVSGPQSAATQSAPKDAASGTPIPTALTEGDAKAPVSTGQLAFAARLNTDTPAAAQPSSPTRPSAPTQSSLSAQPSASHPQTAPAGAPNAATPEADAIQPASAVTQSVQAAPEQTGQRAEKPEAQTLSTPSAAEPTAAPRTDAAHALDQPTDIRSADVDPTPAAGANTTAVRDVRLQVTGADSQRVDVRVMDRGGELRVSVRADDPSLVRSLQDNVADLSTRLDQAHFRSELWTPRTQATAQTDSANTNGRQFSGGEGNLGREDRGQQQNGRQQQQPAWVDDFEENPAKGKSGSTAQWQA